MLAMVSLVFALTQRTFRGLHIRSSEPQFRRAHECTGDAVWAGSEGLLRWMCDPARKSVFDGRSVLELGSGTGHLGLSLAAAGASRVCLSDLAQQLPLLNSNIDLNADLCGKSDVHAEVLPWGTKPAGPVDRRYDLIVGSELTYDADLLSPLARTTAELMRHRSSSKPTVALFAMSRHRAYAHVPDHAHQFIHDLLVAKYGLHAALVGSYDHPSAELGRAFFVGAQAAEGGSPISIFKVTTEPDETRYRGCFQA